MPDFDVAIIGGGPSGLVAARYCLHGQLSTAMFTPDLGGKVNYPFALRDLEPENVIWGAQLVAQFEQQVGAHEKLRHFRQQVTRITRDADGIFQIHLPGGEQESSKTVIIATGAAPQRLYVDGELRYWGRGVSFSAVSHAPYFENRDVAIVGGGRRALVATLELAHIARHIYLIAAKRQMAEMPEATMVRQHRNVSVFSGWEVQAVVGDDFVTGIDLVGLNGETRHLAVEGVFIEFALLPNNELVRGLTDLDEEGHVIINKNCETNVPGLFAAGDVTDIYAEQVMVAVGEGAKAGISAWEYIATHH